MKRIKQTYTLLIYNSIIGLVCIANITMHAILTNGYVDDVHIQDVKKSEYVNRVPIWSPYDDDSCDIPNGVGNN